MYKNNASIEYMSNEQSYKKVCSAQGICAIPNCIAVSGLKSLHIEHIHFEPKM